MTTIIVADTTSGIPVMKAKQLGIPYLPQIIIFGSESFRDDSDINSEIFLKKLKASKDMPKTAAPSPALYNPIFQKALEDGNSVVVICPSGELSGTFRSATAAAQEISGADIYILDSRLIASGLANLVLEANNWAAQGLNPNEIVEKAKELAQRDTTYFLVDTLEYLHKGGRIGGAQKLFGGILQIKPILRINEGKVDSFESQRTKHRGIARIKELVLNECPATAEAHLSLMHGDAYVEAAQLAEELKIEMQLSNIEIYDLTPAILTHSGSGVIGVSFFKES